MANDETQTPDERLRRWMMGDETTNTRMGEAVRGPAGREYMKVVMPVNGPLWDRRVIPLKTTALVNLAILACLNRPHELYGRTLGLLRGGITVAEIQEVFLHIGFYVGNPAGVEATVGLHEAIQSLERRGIDFAWE
jgi:alkylhydroperoxidase/carboxymuconolactone decarboxylase family protein YurZ